MRHFALLGAVFLALSGCAHRVALEPAYSLRSGGELWSLQSTDLPLLPVVPGFDSKLTSIPRGARFVNTDFTAAGEVLHQEVWTYDPEIERFVVVEEISGPPWRNPIPSWWKPSKIEMFQRMAEERGVSPVFYTWPRRD